MHKTLRDGICPHELHHVKATRAVRLGENHVHLALEVAVEALEEIFKEKRNQRSGQLEALVTIIILVIEQGPVAHGAQQRRMMCVMYTILPRKLYWCTGTWLSTRWASTSTASAMGEVFFLKELRAVLLDSRTAVTRLPINVKA